MRQQLLVMKNTELSASAQLSAVLERENTKKTQELLEIVEVTRFCQKQAAVAINRADMMHKLFIDAAKRIEVLLQENDSLKLRLDEAVRVKQQNFDGGFEGDAESLPTTMADDEPWIAPQTPAPSISLLRKVKGGGRDKARENTRPPKDTSSPEETFDAAGASSSPDGTEQRQLLAAAGVTQALLSRLQEVDEDGARDRESVATEVAAEQKAVLRAADACCALFVLAKHSSVGTGHADKHSIASISIGTIRSFLSSITGLVGNSGTSLRMSDVDILLR